MIERLESIKKKFEELNEELMKPEVLSDVKKSKEISIELASIEDVVLVMINILMF